MKLSQVADRLDACFERVAYAFRVLKNDGVRFFWFKATDRMRRIRSPLARPSASVPACGELMPMPSTGLLLDELAPLNHPVSVFIPTRNAGDELDEVLARMRAQRGVPEVEIIIADSGSEDHTTAIAKRHGAKVISIDPNDFNHGDTRNMGIDHGRGDFILYLTQDAIPIGDDFLHRMLRALVDTPDAAAVTCKQVPRSDADLFSSWSMANHYHLLNLSQDKVMGTRDPGKCSPMQRRSIACLDDICTLYRKRPLETYRFRRLPFGEDLDIGLRFMEAGHRIAFLASCAVIHSHNRPPFYSLKRSYVDTKCQSEIMKSTSLPIHSDLSETVGDTVQMYEKINFALHRWDGAAPIGNLLASFRGRGRSETSLSEDTHLRDFMDRLKAWDRIALHKHKKLFFDRLSTQLDDFLSFLTSRSIRIDGSNRDDFNESVYKIFASVVGAQFALHRMQHPASSILEEIEEALSKNV
jgi:glycosyltransferase involved in cell wall biosynthesis